jgi:hypothetical protein
MSVTVADAFEGTHSLCQSYTQGQVDAGWICRVNNGGFPDHLFMRWYHMFETGFEGFPPKMARIRYRHRSGDWTSPYAVHCWLESNGVVALDVVASNSIQANDAGWLAIARSSFSFADSRNIGRWVCFEMEVKLNTPGATDGLYRLWADDSLIVERTNVDLRGSASDKINEMMLDCYWNGGSPKAQSRYYDNLVIATEKIGPITTTGANRGNHIAHSRPAAGSRCIAVVTHHRSAAQTRETFFDFRGLRQRANQRRSAGIEIAVGKR